MCLSVTDSILPYKKCFDGNSRSLGEDMIQGKVIIEPNHGSFGDIVNTNHLDIHLMQRISTY